MKKKNIFLFVYIVQEEYDSFGTNSISTIEEIFDSQNGPQQETLSFPKSIYILCFYKFLERFSYHGIRSVLALYLGLYIPLCNDFERII